MKNFYEWFEDKYGTRVPDENLNGAWFKSYRLPMIVSCACCGMTMALPNAYITNENDILCGGCAADI